MNEDRELLAGISDRDPEAFRELLKRFGSPVVNLACRLLDSRPDAEEVAQEVFLRLYQKPPRLDPSGRLFTWLYRVTTNRCIDLLRERQRRPKPVSLEEPVGMGEGEELLADRIAHPGQPSPREQVARTEMVFAVRRAIAALPQKLRAPLVLSALEELPHEEIAEILSLSAKAVERRIARARSLLKVRLQGYL